MICGLRELAEGSLRTPWYEFYPIQTQLWERLEALFERDLFEILNCSTISRNAGN